MKVTQYEVLEGATIAVDTYADLKALWRMYSADGPLVGRFIVRQPLTPEQFQGLPEALRKRLGSVGDSAAWLEQLHALPDRRG